MTPFLRESQRRRLRVLENHHGVRGVPTVIFLWQDLGRIAMDEELMPEAESRELLRRAKEVIRLALAPVLIVTFPGAPEGFGTRAEMPEEEMKCLT